MLRIQDDPLATLAERATVARPMGGAELNRFLFAARAYRGPVLIAERGYNWSASIAGRPFYYLDAAGIYRDTLTDEAFDETDCSRSNRLQGDDHRR